MARTDRRRRPTADVDAIVVGAGHNGLVAAAYLAKAGRRTLLIEARPIVGGTAASEEFAGAHVNVCSCDHLTFRTTPVSDELELDLYGLRYVDVEPAQVNAAWSGGPSWPQWHDDERTFDELARAHPGDVAGFRRYLAAAAPAARTILAAAVEPPTLRSLARVAWHRRLRGLATIARWSRRSAVDVLSSYVTHDAVVGPGLVTGPMVWGVSPHAPRTGLRRAHIRHALGRSHRPAGRRQRCAHRGPCRIVHRARRDAAHEHAGDRHPRRRRRCDRCRAPGWNGDHRADRRVRLRSPPHVRRVAARSPVRRQLLDRAMAADRVGGRVRVEGRCDHQRDPTVRDSAHPATTVAIAPSVDEMHQAATWIKTGQVLERPAMFVNVPSVLDPTIAPPGRHVFSMEVLFTPYRHVGGWAGSPEPRRWLELFATRCEPGFLDSIIDWRAMTPDVYERRFHLPAGHATSFSGGPLAALRSDDPELTRYETAVPGLYLTGAAAFPGAGIWGASGRNCAAVVLSREV